MIIATIAPFLIILIIIAVIFSIVNAIKKASFFQRLNVKWVLSFYGVLLLVALVLFYVLPNERSLNYIVDNKPELAKAEKASQQLTMATSEGKQIDKENIDGVKVKKRWDFTYEGKKLEITGYDEQYASGFTLVERKDVNDNKIEVTQYHTRTIIQNIELTNEVGPFIIELAEDTLTIGDPNDIEFHVGKFDKEFTITQFTEEWSIEDPFSNEEDIWGENVLYIRVPKDVEVNGEVQFVTE
ncbi:MAG: hypothetical protein ACQEWV_16115 [Bacillota bacterium]